MLLLAKGDRTMQEFARDCGANPSTFTRIMQKANKGASSPELLEAIAENAAAESGVTLNALAEANGYVLTENANMKLRAYFENSEMLIRNIKMLIKENSED